MPRISAQSILNWTPDSIRRTPKNRLPAQPIPGWLSDLYRERAPVTVAYRSDSALAVKVEHRFTVNFPVLVEYDGLAILGNVCHCIKAADGGYMLGVKIHQFVHPRQTDASEAPAVKRDISIAAKLTRAARLGGGTWRLLVPSIVELEG
jgi:hypothetical protein